MSFRDDVADLGPIGDGAALAERLTQVGAELGLDELRIVLLLAERLARGRRTYGTLNVATDHRDFRLEALEEAIDGLAYTAAALIRRAGA